ncbi:MAG: peptidylprolyl isomerase [Nitrospirae bacterium]|nr:peptidylprolyl isomerase [Nitrospirota bacterium]
MRRILLAGAACLALAACSREKMARVETERGTFVIELFDKDAPKTVENFRKLVKADFYDGQTIFRAEQGFVIQTGDPKADGTGGPPYALGERLGVAIANQPKSGEPSPETYFIAPEINARKHVEGTVGMVRRPDSVDPNRLSNGSQFYISLNELKHLDDQYTVFGQVVEGMDVVKAIRKGDTIRNITFK